MRNGIRERLLSEVQGITDVLEPHAADKNTSKPYIVIAQGQENEESDWAGFRLNIEIWPYVSRTSFAEVDALAGQIRKALDQQLLVDPDTGQVFTCQYQGTASEDVVDEDWDAITRGMRFSVLAIQATEPPEAAVVDPWIEALAAWTELLMGDEWHVYRGLWPLGYEQPAILWRIAGEEVRDVSAAAVEVRKRMIGHVRGITQTQQTGAVVLLPWKLQTTTLIPLDVANRRYLRVVDPKSDHRANPITDGQLSVTLTQKVARPIETAPLMGRIYESGSFK